MYVVKKNYVNFIKYFNCRCFREIKNTPNKITTYEIKIVFLFIINL